ncbi:MAG: type II toxin-antitoxin system Phd/YefM family antitoxin [Chloroflexi bacterium]|nr:type II toxin-antitoxin system Phd/YefM family antitoxin [Chloroflexota bacterium]
MSSQRIISATEMRRNFGAIVKRLGKRREHAVIQSGGATVAVLLPVAEYEQLIAHKRRKIVFRDFARQLGREVEKRGMGEEQFADDLEKTKRKIFAGQYGKPA